MQHHHPAPVWFGSQALEQLQALISREKPSKLFFLVDSNTHQHCLPQLLQALEELPEMEILEVEPGEETKSAEVLVQLWEALSALEADRQAMLLNLGGGVVTDLGGFLAGAYLRGIRFVNIPTSLLAMVDASAGGKNGINLGGLKNRVGLFLEPEAVFIFPEMLESLPARERLSGFAEMLKHGLIADADYWIRLKNFDINNHTPGLELLKRSVEIKQEIVAEDFRESGLRKILNFGHTLGHAIESHSHQTGHPLLHGEAIALGMMIELWLSHRFAGLSREETDQAMQSLRQIYPGLEMGFAFEELLPFMRGDKKNLNQKLSFSLLNEIGKARPDFVLNEEDVRMEFRSFKDQLA